jgi:Leucine-rich repeat (LRR) protein
MYCNYLGLKEINLSGGTIEEIPPGILPGLAHLNKLNLSNNRIKAAPEELTTVTKVKEVDLRGNPIVVW